MCKILTKQICENWITTDKTKNPLTGKYLDYSLKKIILKRCTELELIDDNSSYSNDILISTANKYIFNIKYLSNLLSTPNLKEINEIRNNLPYLFDLSLKKIQSDNHRIDIVLLNYHIIDKNKVKLVKKFIKYILNIPNAREMNDK